MKLKRFVCIVVVFVFVLTMFRTEDASASSIAEIQAQIDANKKLYEENKEKLAQIEAALEELSAEEDSVLNEIVKMDADMATLNVEAAELQIRIDDLNQNIEENEAFIKKLEEDIDESNLLLEQRLRTSFKRGDIGYLDVIFEAESLLDALTRLDMIQLIVREDVKLLAEIEDLKNNYEDLKITQENEKENRIEVMDQLVVKIDDLEVAQSEKEMRMSELEEDKDDLIAQEEAFQAADQELEANIQRLQTSMAYVGGTMLWPLPLSYTRITSPFGSRIHPIYGYWSQHNGVDIGAPTGVEIYAVNSGVVLAAEYHYSYGNYVVIDHGGKISTLYAHASKLLVSAGQTVNIGDTIALIGSTGQSTGPHLHFEVRENGVRQDPIPYVSGN